MADQRDAAPRDQARALWLTEIIAAANAELAQAHSACSSASQGGNLGQITEGQTSSEFEEALFDLEPGSIGQEPVATRYGFHIIRLDRKHEGRELPFELVAEG